MGELIAVNELQRYFNVSSGTLHAVDNVTFSINEGETLGVVGESGCGKSTLGRVMIHLLESTGGKIYYKGEDVTRVKPQKLSQLRKEMQIIFQDPFSSLNPRMTVYQIIAEPMAIQGGYSRKQIDDIVYDIMDTVGLARRLVNSLSLIHIFNGKSGGVSERGNDPTPGRGIKTAAGVCKWDAS